MPDESRSLISEKPPLRLPKAELHAHLNGSIPPSLVSALLPQGERVTSTTVLQPVDDMRAYFEPWTVFRRLATSREDTERIIQVAADFLSADNVEYAELRNSVRHIAALNAISLEESLEWLCSGMDEASARTGVDLRLIVSLTREGFSDDGAVAMLDAVRSVAHPRVVGMDLTGDEGIAVPQSAAAVFRRAKDEQGLGVTIHAGETGPASNIFWAIKDCKADRIGHGVAAATDESCLELLRESGVCVEVCLTSNLMTRAVPALDAHPVVKLLESSVEFVLCTDNPQMHLRSLSHEYELFASLPPVDCDAHALLDAHIAKREWRRHRFI